MGGWEGTGSKSSDLGELDDGIAPAGGAPTSHPLLDVGPHLGAPQVCN